MAGDIHVAVTGPAALCSAGQTSDPGPAALHHRGLGGRRQEHADRPPAVRQQAGVRGPARARRAGERAPRRRGCARSGAAHRRPAGGARAGDHDRRGLPLLRDGQAAVHHRRLPRAPAVHAQHGHGCLHGGSGGDPAGRAQGRAGAVQAPRLHQRAAGHPAPGGGGEQDGPRGVLAGALRRAGRGVRRVRREARRGARNSSTCRSRRWRATTSSSARRGWTGTTGRRCWRCWSGSRWPTTTPTTRPRASPCSG